MKIIFGTYYRMLCKTGPTLFFYQCLHLGKSYLEMYECVWIYVMYEEVTEVNLGLILYTFFDFDFIMMKFGFLFEV